jgi:hypothetical protein
MHAIGAAHGSDGVGRHGSFLRISTVNMCVRVRTITAGFAVPSTSFPMHIDNSVWRRVNAQCYERLRTRSSEPVLLVGGEHKCGSWQQPYDLR